MAVAISTMGILAMCFLYRPLSGFTLAIITCNFWTFLHLFQDQNWIKHQLWNSGSSRSHRKKQEGQPSVLVLTGISAQVLYHRKPFWLDQLCDFSLSFLHFFISGIWIFELSICLRWYGSHAPIKPLEHICQQSIDIFKILYASLQCQQIHCHINNEFARMSRTTAYSEYDPWAPTRRRYSCSTFGLNMVIAYILHILYFCNAFAENTYIPE